MKLIPVNDVKETAKYGFESEFLDYRDGFKGHVVCLIVAITNKQTGVVEKNYLSETLENRDELIKELIASETITLAENQITQFDEDRKNLVSKIVYYLAYVPENFTTSMPTISQENIPSNASMNAHYEGEVEIMLLLDEGLKRYITMAISSVNISMLSMVHDAFDDRDAFDEAFGCEPNNLKWQKENDEYGAGYAVDFYSDCGERFDMQLSLSELENAVASVRLTKLKCIIDK